MAQNEMKAKPALPERVRSMEGLGVSVGSTVFFDRAVSRRVLAGRVFEPVRSTGGYVDEGAEGCTANDTL